MIKTVTARELQEKISKKNLHLLDVREKVEYAMGHVPTAVNLPLSEFVSSYQTLDK
ncbi:MAG: rhodanese-like domain-containing protein, partial [Streptococcus sp.]|nr:rhodanese-like domain-containing protein [Streptococcus sp.]